MHFKKTIISLAIIALILATASAAFEAQQSTLETNNHQFKKYLTGETRTAKQSHTSFLHAILSPDYTYSKIAALKGYGIFGTSGSRNSVVVEWAVIALSIYMLSNVIE